MIFIFPFSYVVTSYPTTTSAGQYNNYCILLHSPFFSVSDSSASVGLGTVLGLSLIVLVFSITLNIYCAITKQVEMITVTFLIININYK